MNQQLCDSCGLRRTTDVARCPYCGALTPLGAQGTAPPRRTRLRGLLVVAIGCLLVGAAMDRLAPPGWAQAAGAALGVLGGLGLVFLALLRLTGPGA